MAPQERTTVATVGACSTRLTAADEIAARLTNRKPRTHVFRYIAQHISFGRKDGLVQWGARR